MLKEVLNTIPEAPLDGIGATPRNNEMGTKFNLSHMMQPNKHKVRDWFDELWTFNLEFEKLFLLETVRLLEDFTTSFHENNTDLKWFSFGSEMKQKLLRNHKQVFQFNYLENLQLR